MGRRDAGARDSGVEPALAGHVGAFARLTVGFACASLSVLLMNQALFPIFDAVFTYTRDVSITFSALAMIMLAVIATRAPDLVDGRLLTAVSAAVSAIAGPLVMIAVHLGSAGLLIPTACLAALARTWAVVCVSLSAVVALRTTPAGVVTGSVAAGYLAASTADALLMRLVPVTLATMDALAVLAVVVLPLAMLGLTHRANRGLFASIQASVPAADLSVTRPASFLPLTSRLYMLQFVVFIAFGFALRFGEVAGTPLSGQLIATVALALLVAFLVATRGELPLDGLFNLVVLALTAGLMLAAVSAHDGAYVANSLLMMGNALFNVVFTCTLVALAARNHLNAYAVFGWANGLASLGTTVGAAVGVLSNDLVRAGSADAASYVAIAVAVGLVAYVLFALRGFSFRQEIQGVVAEAAPAATVDGGTGAAGVAGEESGDGIATGEPSPDPSAGGDAPAADEARHAMFADRCHAIARAHGLTPREEETFAMLARGRNREYIEEHLQVSRNTVKAHVKHVYAKLGIHSHQELLDLVERGDGARR